MLVVQGFGHDDHAVVCCLPIERRRGLIRRPAEGEHIDAIGHSGGKAKGCCDVVPGLNGADIADGFRHRTDWIGVEATGEGSQKNSLAVRCAQSRGIGFVGNQCLDIAADGVPSANLAVVHEHPFPMREGVAIRPAGRRACCCPDMGEE